MPRRCRQRRRNPGLGEVQYSYTQPIADAVCGYILLVHTCPTAAKQATYCDLICTRRVSQGGGAFSCCRSPIPGLPQERAIRSRSRVRVYAAALRSGLGCAPSCSTCRAQSETDFFSATIPQRHNIDEGAGFYFIFERQHHRTDFSVANVFCSPIMDWLISQSFFFHR